MGMNCSCWPDATGDARLGFRVRKLVSDHPANGRLVRSAEGRAAFQPCDNARLCGGPIPGLLRRIWSDLAYLCIMSGIEVTGIALAVFPLLMKSVKMTKLGIGEMKKAVKYRVLLKDMLQDLSTESAIFENTLEYLLLRSCIFESEAHLKELIRDPGGDAWKHPEYELALQRFLAKSYDTYLQLIESMRINLEALTKRLKELEPPDACVGTFCPNLLACD